MKKASTLTLTLCCALLLAGCGKKVEHAREGAAATNITVARAQVRDVEVLQHSVGVVDTEAAPMVAAQVAAQVNRVQADVGDAVKAGQLLAVLDDKDLLNARRIARADVKRVQALLKNQRRLTARYRKLFAQKFISASALDAAVAQLAALREQMKGAQAALRQARRNLSKTRIYAPVGGRVQQRLVSRGDYVSPGKTLFQIATTQRLQVRLPFPEGVAERIRPGLEVRLSTPTAPGKAVVGRVQEIRPVIGAQNRAFEAIISVANPGGWAPGASVDGAVRIAEHPRAVVVPETSVVLRPAGRVVYVVSGGRAQQRIVRSGEKQGGMMEILSGLAAGETVAVDGAGFLTDGARVNVKATAATPHEEGPEGAR